MKKFQTEVHLSREMKLLDVTMIGVGAMIGAGIFVLTGIAAGVAGPALLISFALNGAVALLTAMSYAELGSCYHDAGGGYLWVKEGLPKWNGFLSGWMSWFAHAVACSLYALGFGAYFEHVFSEFGIALPHWGILSPQKFLAVVIASLFAYVNFRGASETGKIGNIVTITKIAILAIFIGFGLELVLHREHWTNAFSPFMAHGWSGVLKAMGLTFIAFQGFEVISQCSEEVRNPKKNIPKAIFLSLLIVIPLYVLVAGVAMGSVQPEGGLSPWDFLALRKEIALVDVAKLFFPGGGIMLLIGGIISTMSALNATVYSSSRVAFAMGRDRNFPALFGKVHPKRFTPFVAIFFSFVIVIGMSLSLPIEDVASAADIMFLLLFLQVNVTLIRLRKKRPELDRGFLVPLFPYLTIIGIVMLLFLAVYMFNYSPLGWFVTAGWIAAGLLVYRGYASKREIEYVHRRKALERLEKKNFTILVPISNPRTAPSLVRIALAVAHRHDAEILLLHIVEVEEGMPLRSGYARTDQVLSVLEKAERLAYEGRIPVRSIVNVSHRISEGILETALEEDANFIVLGRAKRPGVVDRLFASVIDSVLDQAPCEVAVLHGELPASGIKTILIPFGLNIHTRLAFELAPNLAEYFKSKVQVVSVVEPHTSRQESADQIEQLMKQAEENKLTPHIHVIRNTAVTDGVVRRSGHADLIVMGGRSGGFLGLLFGQSLTQEITDRAACPVLWVNEYEEVPSLWQQLIAPFKKEVSKANG